MRRICISGASGVGKSTLAQWISKEYKIPYITTSAKPLIKEFGYFSHGELLKAMAQDKKLAIDFQTRLLDMRYDMTKRNLEFVTDRAPIDNIVYYLMEAAAHDEEVNSDNYIDRAMNLLSMHTHYIVLPLLPQMKSNLEDDRQRVTNYWYQYTWDSVLWKVINEIVYPNITKLKLEMAILPTWDKVNRQNTVRELLSNLKIIKNESEANRILGHTNRGLE